MKLLILLALTGCAHSDPWTKQDTTLQVAATIALVADAYTTANIQYHNLYEAGPARHVLGSQPSTSDTWQYFGSLAVSHYLISRALPGKWRPYWQGSFIIIHANAAYKNCMNGLC